MSEKVHDMDEELHGDGDKEFYISLIKEIVADQSDMLGEKVAVQKARAAPLEIDKDDEITDYYGKGESVLQTLVAKYEEVWGTEVARRKVRDTVEDNVSEEKYELLPEYMIPEGDQKGVISRILEQLRGT